MSKEKKLKGIVLNNRGLLNGDFRFTTAIRKDLSKMSTINTYMIGVFERSADYFFLSKPACSLTENIQYEGTREHEKCKQ